MPQVVDAVDEMDEMDVIRRIQLSVDDEHWVRWDEMDVSI